jgi:hypothetical protein
MPYLFSMGRLDPLGIIMGGWTFGVPMDSLELMELDMHTSYNEAI